MAEQPALIERLFAQVESCNFECEAGPLKNCTPWNDLKREARDTLAKLHHQAATIRRLQGERDAVVSGVHKS